jgi:hypothetical protein
MAKMTVVIPIRKRTAFGNVRSIASLKQTVLYKAEGAPTQESIWVSGVGAPSMN